MEYGDKFAKFHFDLAMKEPPGELFHYTSGESFLKIIASQYVFATERTYLNDPKEFEWGLEAFRKLVTESPAGQFDKLFIDQVSQAVCEKSQDALLFVFSLSANPDLLSQWRAYACDARGFVLGFDGPALRDRAGFGEYSLRGIDLDIMPAEQVLCYHLLPVIYMMSLSIRRFLAF